ncbi:hypothetical protein AXG93_1854s1000 [Marchantia polymorpha subsp. ruderalis]|uniref:Uncharacterized protein n=1 Tax=Marchantia polymorpha subsp. ruderalis TaxID=1480154 RepID=A0A176WRF2_MARPO|nr:hypothetical protein AXG93_1854s1000 [Marchantia polymorpha subsp. ruderalis]
MLQDLPESSRAYTLSWFALKAKLPFQANEASAAFEIQDYRTRTPTRRTAQLQDGHYKKNSTEVHGNDEKHDHEEDHKYRSDADRHVGVHDKDGRHAHNRDGKRKQEEGSDCVSKWNKGRNPYKPAADVKYQTPATPGPPPPSPVAVMKSDAAESPHPPPVVFPHTSNSTSQAKLFSSSSPTNGGQVVSTYFHRPILIGAASRLLLGPWISKLHILFCDWNLVFSISTVLP